MSVIRPSKCLQQIKLHDCKIFIVVEHGLITCLTVTCKPVIGIFSEGGGWNGQRGIYS